MCVLITTILSVYKYKCALPEMCPHTPNVLYMSLITTILSVYKYKCVLLEMCPHTRTIEMCPHTRTIY